MKATPPPDPTPTETSPPAVPTTTDPATPPAVTPSAPSEPHRTATWPEWFPVVDVALVTIAVVAAFLAASFTARNSDLWLHLAGGRALVDGTYTPGADPFSYTGADRAWANTSWLSDLLMYAAYAADESGAALVAIKAILAALAFGGLLLLRRAGHPLWPWAVLILLAAVASGPYLIARPLTASVLFLAATLVVIFYRPWVENTWRQPAILAGLFAVWANVDGWFLLGPFTVALVLVGEWLNRYLPAEEGGEGDAFPPNPPVKGLARALGVGLAACLLNPMLLAALVKDPGEALAQLGPVELGFGVPAGASRDLELAGLTLSPMGNSEFWYREVRGETYVRPNAVAFGVLLFAVPAAIAAGFSRMRATHVLLFLGFAILGFQHARLTPFYAVVAVPLAAWHLNALSARARLGPWTDPRTRMLLLGSGVGRVLTVVAGLVVVAFTYPGWLHPSQQDATYGTVYPNRLDWRVEPDPGLARTARLIDRWRDEGRLPADLRGLGASTQLGDYLAWYAPEEKVFVDSRYVFHREELPDLLTVREVTAGKIGPASEEPLEVDAVWDVADRYGAGYLVATTGHRPVNLPGVLGQLRGQEELAREVGRRPTDRVGDALLEDGERWELWHLDGRSAVLGRTAARSSAPAAFETLRFDPVRQAFGPGAEPLPEGKVVFPPTFPETTLWDEFYRGPPEPLPITADDARVLLYYAEYLNQRADVRWVRNWSQAVFQQMAVAGVGPISAQAFRGPGQRLGAEDAEVALPVLILRASRRAIAAAPDRPDGYQLLAAAYQLPFAPVARDEERELQVLTAKARSLARTPPPDRVAPDVAFQAFRDGVDLSQRYTKTQQLDLAHAALKQALEYAEKVPPAQLAMFATPQLWDKMRNKSEADVGQAVLNDLKQQEDQLYRTVEIRSARVDRASGAAAKFEQARAQGLPLKAVEVYKAAGESEFDANLLGINIALVQIELAAGHLEQATAYLDQLEAQLKTDREKLPPDMIRTGESLVRQLKGMAARLAGDYPAAAVALDVANFPTIPADELAAGTELPRVLTGLSAVAGPIVGQVVPTRLATVGQVLADEAAYQYDRAMLAVAEGNIPVAERRLKQAAKPQGVDLNRVNPELAGRVAGYLRLIERAQTGPGERGASAP